MTTEDREQLGATTVQITEDEAAVYDRQIRLWGLEAQQRMRNATILVVRMKGLATEVVKNIVLAGIGKLVIMDDENVDEEDLGAGFFFQEGDVGKKRVDAAKARVEALNPRVVVETNCASVLSSAENLDAIVLKVDLVCVTDQSRDDMIRVNDCCRQLGKPFYAGGTYGLLGYIFCDLLRHEYIAPDRSAAKDAPKSVKITVEYPPLREAILHKWTGLTKKQTKELNPAVGFIILGLWEYQAQHDGMLPVSSDNASELETITSSLIAAANVRQDVLKHVPHERVQTMSTTARHEFSPVCAVVGGMLAQDILKALAAKEPPIGNFFTFDGTTGGGTVCRMSMK